MRRLALCLSVSVVIGSLAGCGGIVLAPRPTKPVVVHKGGPPAHAPAHGHRRKHESGPELRFDTDLGVYVVVGHVDIYFHDGWFIRIHDGGWQVSATLGGSWEARSAEWVPPGLRAEHQGGKPKVGGHGAAKRKW